MPTKFNTPSDIESISIDKTKALAHLRSLEEHATLYKGKIGYNPFVYLHKEIYPLIEGIVTGDKILGEKEYNSIMDMTPNVDNYKV